MEGIKVNPKTLLIYITVILLTIVSVNAQEEEKAEVRNMKDEMTVIFKRSGSGRMSVITNTTFTKNNYITN